MATSKNKASSATSWMGLPFEDSKDHILSSRMGMVSEDDRDTKDFHGREKASKDTGLISRMGLTVKDRPQKVRFKAFFSN